MSELIAALVERQKSAGEPDKPFARRLGVSRQAWQKIRTGECGIGAKALAGIIRAYPDLTELVQSHLSNTANSLADDRAADGHISAPQHAETAKGPADVSLHPQTGCRASQGQTEGAA